ncbi:MAG: hypothetical protein ACLFWG_00340 [Longimicrobiales bacterium]
MAGADRGVPIEMDRERRLRYPMSAVREVEDRFEINMVKGEEFQTENLDDFIWLIWLGLRHEDPGPPSLWRRLLARLGIGQDPEPRITQEWVAENVDMQTMEAVGTAMMRAMGGTLEEASVRAAQSPREKDEADEAEKGGRVRAV